MKSLQAVLAVAFISAQSLFTLAMPETSTSLGSISLQSDRDAKVVRPTRVPDLPVSLRPLELKPGENAWAVQIVSRGGFIGAGRGNLTVTSQGGLTWDGPGGSCSRILPEHSLQTLSRLVVSADASPTWNVSKLIGLCSDCYITTMLMQRRERDGVERTYSLTWDDASDAQVPAAALKIYEAFIANAGCKP
jgi:hypothetical protein